MAVDPHIKRRRQTIIAVAVTLFVLLMAAAIAVLPAYNELTRAERDLEISRQQISGSKQVSDADQKVLLTAVPTAAEVQGRLNKIGTAADSASGLEFRSARQLGPVTPLEGITGLSKQPWRVQITAPLTGVAGLIGALRDSVSVDPTTGVAQVRGPAPVRIIRTRVVTSGSRAVAVIDLDVYIRS